MGGQQAREPAPARGWARGAGWRLAVVLVLLAVAAVGERARAAAHLSSAGMFDPGEPVVFVVAVFLVVAAVLVLAVLLVGLYKTLAQRGQRGRAAAPTPGMPMPWWMRLLVALAGAVLALLPLAVLAAFLLTARRRKPRSISLRGAAPHRLPTGPSHPTTTSAVLLTALAVLVALAVVWLWRRRRAGVVLPEAAPPEPPVLATALHAATQALRTPRSPREAIIASYVAMEEALAAAGSPRYAADTPEDLLARAAVQGLVRRPAAQRLTSLFREARFSPHPLGEAERDDARAALDDIGAELASEG